MVNSIFKGVCTIVVFVFCLLLVLFPATFSRDVLEGLSLWAQNVLPTLLPFVFFSKFLALPNKTKLKENPFEKFFNIGKDATSCYLTSLICGYPLGAKTTCDRFLQGKINENQAFNLAVLCSNASPVYLVATISCAFLQGFATVVLLVAHYLSAMIVCIIFNRKNKGEFTQTVCLKQSQNDYMTDTVFTVLNVGGYVAIFYLICSMICHLFSIDLTNPISAFFLGLLEMTNGANLLSKSLPIPLATPLCCGVVSMGGLCVIFQSLPYLKKCKIKTAPFVMAKITQGAVATILCWIGCKFIAF